MNTLYLIRHGRTIANEQHLYCGSTDLPLSEAGAAELQSRHYHISGARFLTSGMLRTEQTLEILFGSVPHGQDTRFREVNFGIFEMKSYEMLKDTPDYQKWLAGDNEKNVPPEGESGQQMRCRILEGLKDLTGQDTVLVCHGGVIAAIMEHLFPEEGKSRYQWQPEPGTGYKICGNIYSKIPE